MKLLTLTAGVAPLLLLPTLLGSPLQQEAPVQDDCAKAPCTTRTVVTCETICESHSKSQDPYATTCESAQASHSAVATLASQEQDPAAKVALARSAHVQGQHEAHSTEEKHVETLRALLQGEVVDPDDHEVVFDFEGSDGGATRWLRVSASEPGSNIVILEDVTDPRILDDVTNLAPVHDSLKLAIETLKQSLESEELLTLTQNMDQPGELRENLSEALDALDRLVGQGLVGQGLVGQGLVGQGLVGQGLVGQETAFDGHVHVKTTCKEIVEAPQTITRWSASAPHIVIQGDGPESIEVRTRPNIKGKHRILAKVLDENGDTVELDANVFEFNDVTSVTAVPAPPAAPAPTLVTPHAVGVRRPARVTPQPDEPNSEIAQILSEMRAEMREMRASMAELRAQLESERAGLRNSQRQSPQGGR